MQLILGFKHNAVVYKLSCVWGSGHGVRLACVVDGSHETGSARHDENVITNELYGLEFGGRKLVVFLGSNFDSCHSIFAGAVSLEEGNGFVAVGVFVNIFFIV